MSTEPNIVLKNLLNEIEENCLVDSTFSEETHCRNLYESVGKFYKNNSHVKAFCKGRQVVTNKEIIENHKKILEKYYGIIDKDFLVLYFTKELKIGRQECELNKFTEEFHFEIDCPSAIENVVSYFEKDYGITVPRN